MLQLLPAIDLRGGQCVRLRQGDFAQETVFSNDPPTMAKQWEQQGGDWLHLVDLDGAREGKPVNTSAIRAIRKAVSCPIELGGGLRDRDAIELMLDDVGIDRVIIGTQALKQPAWFRQMTDRYPGRVALGLDARDGFVATAGWSDVSQTPMIELASQFVDSQLAAVIYTNIANDGMMQGIDDGTLAGLMQLANLGLPTIASGGVTTQADLDRLMEINASQPDLIGAIIGRALYEGTISLSEAAQRARHPKV